MGGCAGKHSDAIQPTLSPEPSRKSLGQDLGNDTASIARTRSGGRRNGVPEQVFSRSSLSGIVKLVIKGVSFLPD